MPSYPVVPVPKPRQTQRDRWAKRPAVVRYRAFADEVRLRGIKVVNGDHVTFVMPMPRTWSKKKKSEMEGQPHQQRPDIDNMCKSLLDALYEDDSHIWDIHLTKIWGHDGAIQITQANAIDPGQPEDS